MASPKKEPAAALVNFRADVQVRKVLDRLTAVAVAEGVPKNGARSQVIRKAILDAGKRLDESK